MGHRHEILRQDLVRSVLTGRQHPKRVHPKGHVLKRRHATAAAVGGNHEFLNRFGLGFVGVVAVIDEQRRLERFGCVHASAKPQGHRDRVIMMPPSHRPGRRQFHADPLAKRQLRPTRFAGCGAHVVDEETPVARSVVPEPHRRWDLRLEMVETDRRADLDPVHEGLVRPAADRVRRHHELQLIPAVRLDRRCIFASRCDPTQFVDHRRPLPDRENQMPLRPVPRHRLRPHRHPQRARPRLPAHPRADHDRVVRPRGQIETANSRVAVVADRHVRRAGIASKLRLVRSGKALRAPDRPQRRGVRIGFEIVGPPAARGQPAQREHNRHRNQ